MNFFERQRAAKIESRRLHLLFVPALIAMLLVTAVGTLWPLLLANMDTDVLVYAFVLVSAVMLAIFAFGVSEGRYRLRDGGVGLALDCGATFVRPDTTDPQLRRLRNVAEEMAIASGVMVPHVFVLEKQLAINAFVAGTEQGRMALVVTNGALTKLNRDELQGIVAHEFSHILNCDTELNIELAGLVYGFYMPARVFNVLRAGPAYSVDNDEFGPGKPTVFAFFLLPLLPIGWFGRFLGRWLKAGVNRQREFLADASAVQFTRQNQGIVGALKKIAGLQGHGLLRGAQMEQVSHMLLCDGIGLKGRLATHPPIVERIRALDPDFLAGDLASLAAHWRSRPPNGLDEDQVLGLARPVDAVPPASGTVPTHGTETIANSVGTSSPHARCVAQRILAAIPEDLHDDATNDERAQLVVLGLLFSTDRALRDRQIDALATISDSPRVEAIIAVAARAANLDPVLRLPLASMAFPILAQTSRSDLDRLAAEINVLCAVDGKIDLFEYCLGTIFKSLLPGESKARSLGRVGGIRIRTVNKECSVLFAFIAHTSHDDAGQAKAAFLAAMSQLFPQQSLTALPARPASSEVDLVWPVLDRLEPISKQLLIEAVDCAVTQDRNVGLADYELVRVISARLHCPLPPEFDVTQATTKRQA